MSLFTSTFSRPNTIAQPQERIVSEDGFMRFMAGTLKIASLAMLGIMATSVAGGAAITAPVLAVGGLVAGAYLYGAVAQADRTRTEVPTETASGSRRVEGRFWNRFAKFLNPLRY